MPMKYALGASCARVRSGPIKRLSYSGRIEVVEKDCAKCLPGYSSRSECIWHEREPGSDNG